MLYASHYFWTGLEVRALVPDLERGAGFWFVTVNRARSDGLSGFTGMFVRRRVRSAVQEGALAGLRTTKEKLEQSRQHDASADAIRSVLIRVSLRNALMARRAFADGRRCG
jgi:hypothetical protein